jgi:hypothetical protein
MEVRPDQWQPMAATIPGMNEDMLAVDKEIIKAPSQPPLLKRNGVDQCLVVKSLQGHSLQHAQNGMSHMFKGL